VFTSVLEEHLIFFFFSKEVKSGMWVVYDGKRADQTEKNDRTGQTQSQNGGQETELCLV
jgi:hypothetical protein